MCSEVQLPKVSEEDVELALICTRKWWMLCLHTECTYAPLQLLADAGADIAYHCGSLRNNVMDRGVKCICLRCDLISVSPAQHRLLDVPRHLHTLQYRLTE